jgi:peptide deformylase
MPVLRITKHGEPVLKKVSAPVDYDAIKPELPKLLRDMWATMNSVNGVGLAAPQIGINIRLAVIDVKPQGKRQPLVLINPEIVSAEGVLNDEEGCLSIPGVYSQIQRKAKVTIKATDQNGEPYQASGTGLLARAFQHEIDHLDGKLFIDHLEFEKKLKVMALIKDIRTTWT